MSSQVQIFTDRKENVKSIPIQAVTLERNEGSTASAENGNKEVVFIYKDGIVKSTPVKTGISDDQHIEILEGLTEDQEVVIGPYRIISKELTDGMKVKIMSQDEKEKKKSSIESDK
jgi:HlyD family secretion protein